MALKPEDAVRKLLIDDSTVSALVSTRIYPAGSVPQTPQLPYIVTSRVSRSHTHHMTAGAGLAISRSQIDIYAKTQTKVDTLADGCREALDGYRGTVTNGAQSLVVKMCHLSNDILVSDVEWSGQNSGTPRITQDYKIGHSESVPTFS